MSTAPDAVRIAGVVRESIVDGPGIRYVIFAQGCPRRCGGCHNEATHDFSGGEMCKIDKLISDIEKNPLLSGVTFSGGEPFCQPEGFSRLALKLKEKNMNIVSFTGYTYEELVDLQDENENIKKLLGSIDILIDGPFVMEQRDLTQQFKGSLNQRYIDMNATRQQGGKPAVLENL